MTSYRTPLHSLTNGNSPNRCWINMSAHTLLLSIDHLRSELQKTSRAHGPVLTCPTWRPRGEDCGSGPDPDQTFCHVTLLSQASGCFRCDVNPGLLGEGPPPDLLCMWTHSLFFLRRRTFLCLRAGDGCDRRPVLFSGTPWHKHSL